MPIKIKNEMPKSAPMDKYMATDKVMPAKDPRVSGKPVSDKEMMPSSQKIKGGRF